jgi:hypothetical protein
MALPDASIIETVLPSADMAQGASMSGYRIRGDNGQITELPSLREVSAYLHGRFDQATYEAMIAEFGTQSRRQRPGSR